MFTMLPYLILPNISDYLMQLYVLWDHLSFLNWSLKKLKLQFFSAKSQSTINLSCAEIQAISSSRLWLKNKRFVVCGSEPEESIFILFVMC